MLVTLDASKAVLYESLLRNEVAPVPAKSLTIKILNLFLSRYHFLARSARLFSSPYGVIVDPINNCQLACPGCVHSTRPKELRLFDWPSGMLSESLFADFMRQFGPCAIETAFYDYGEPLLNPNTPRLIRLAKNYLARTSLSTNMGVKHFDAEAYVNSGLDYMTVSIDGATQSTYEQFRRKGDIETVFENVRRLLQTRTRMGKHTPVVSWQYLAFEHNEHEIEDAITMARRLDVDQFTLVSPYDVSWDDPGIRLSKRAPRTILFRPEATQWIRDNFNPFPSEIEAAPIEQEFAADWRQRSANVSDSDGIDPGAASRRTCRRLYKNIWMDATGRILPCGGAPTRDKALIFGNAQSGADHFNSEQYRLARLSFANPEEYRERADAALIPAPHCAKCEWYDSQNKAHVDGTQLAEYFTGLEGGIFSPASVAILGSC